MAFDSCAPFSELAFEQQLKTIAKIIEEMGDLTSSGFEQLEHRRDQNVFDLPVVNTVYEWIAIALGRCGVVGELVTLGQIAKAFNVRKDTFDESWCHTQDSQAQRELLHEIGCHCHGPVQISVQMVAERLRKLIRYLR